jgi:hypothetical protein
MSAPINISSILNDRLKSLSRNCECRTIRHCTVKAREDRRIDHSQTVDTADLELGVHTIGPVTGRTHTATGGCVMAERFIRALAHVDFRIRQDSSVVDADVVGRSQEQLTPLTMA